MGKAIHNFRLFSNGNKEKWEKRNDWKVKCATPPMTSKIMLNVHIYIRFSLNEPSLPSINYTKTTN